MLTCLSTVGYFAESWTEQYWYMGGLVRSSAPTLSHKSFVNIGQATIAMSLIVLFSFMWFRVRSYELFLLIHIALSVVTLVGLF
jgi:ferric-chelate reductase